MQLVLVLIFSFFDGSFFFSFFPLLTMFLQTGYLPVIKLLGKKSRISSAIYMLLHRISAVCFPPRSNWRTRCRMSQLPSIPDI